MSKYLEITNLTYEYPDGYKALNEISFNLEEGDSLGILGPNGAGTVSYTRLTLPTTPYV